MTLLERSAHLFHSLVSKQAGVFELTTPVRRLKLELSGGQVLGADGIPELMEGLPELAGMTLSGNLAKDLNLALTQGVGYEQAASTASANLGRVLVVQLGHPMAETSFTPAPPSPGAWPLQTSLVHMVRTALRETRDAETVAQRLGDSMDHVIVRTGVPSEPFALDPVALRTLGGARGGSLGELLLHSGRGVPSRTRSAWLALDLLLHLGLLASTERAAPPVKETRPPARPVSQVAPPPKRKQEKREKTLREYEDLDLSTLDAEPAPVITPREEAPGHVIEGPPQRSTEQELWYGIQDLTPEDEDEEDPFGLFSGTGSDESLIEPDPQDLTGEFIWAEEGHKEDAWAQRVAERTVAVPEVSLAQLQHLPARFRTMNPLEVLGLEPGDTVTFATVREAYEQRFAQFDPAAWAASGPEAGAWAAQARAYVSAAYRKAQTQEGVEKYAARWRADPDDPPTDLEAAYEEEDTAPVVFEES